MMDDDATDAAWHQQELEERQQIEESWQAMCAACLDEWKAQFEAMTSHRKELNDELECF
jgi:hypothetical protein